MYRCDGSLRLPPTGYETAKKLGMPLDSGLVVVGDRDHRRRAIALLPAGLGRGCFLVYTDCGWRRSEAGAEITKI